MLRNRRVTSDEIRNENLVDDARRGERDGGERCERLHAGCRARAGLGRLDRRRRGWLAHGGLEWLVGLVGLVGLVRLLRRRRHQWNVGDGWRRGGRRAEQWGHGRWWGPVPHRLYSRGGGVPRRRRVCGVRRSRRR